MVPGVFLLSKPKEIASVVLLGDTANLPLELPRSIAGAGGLGAMERASTASDAKSPTPET
jgi:hypothetical protein